MKNYILLFSILCIAFAGNAQRNEFGVFGGVSYYNGELNPGKQFGMAQPAVGLYWDSHINSRYTWRTIGTYSKLKADDNMTDISLNNFRDLQMNSEVVDLSGQIVFNFLPYSNTINTKQYTPYIFIGLALFNARTNVSSMSADSSNGTAFPKENYSSSITSLAIPFGIGFKVILGSITLGLEWNFRKTFTDKLDGIDNQYVSGNVYEDPVTTNHPKGFQKGIFNTNDWYSYAGITIGYRAIPKKNACPGMF